MANASKQGAKTKVFISFFSLALLCALKLCETVPLIKFFNSNDVDGVKLFNAKQINSLGGENCCIIDGLVETFGPAVRASRFPSLKLLLEAMILGFLLPTRAAKSFPP